MLKDWHLYILLKDWPVTTTVAIVPQLSTFNKRPLYCSFAFWLCLNFTCMFYVHVYVFHELIFTRSVVRLLISCKHVRLSCVFRNKLKLKFISPSSNCSRVICRVGRYILILWVWHIMVDNPNYICAYQPLLALRAGANYIQCGDADVSWLDLHHLTWRRQSYVSQTCHTNADPHPLNSSTFRPVVGQRSEVVPFPVQEQRCGIVYQATLQQPRRCRCSRTGWRHTCSAAATKLFDFE